MNSQTLKNKTVSGVFWRFGERILAQGVSFIVTLVLARLLMPEDYGAISIITVFITIANIFITDGFCAALIQKKDTDSLDYTTILIGGFALSMLLYALCFVTAPWIARFFNMPILAPTLRVLALRLPIASINSVQVAYVTKKMQFKKFFWATFLGTAGSAMVGVLMAHKGFGVWALIGQNLFNYTVDTIVLFIVINRIPKISFSFERLKSLFSYGYKILITNLLFTFTDQLRTLIIGKFYSSQDLAFYSKGKHFPQLISSNISGPISSVLFPAISSVQNNKEAVRSFLRKSTQIISYTVSPLVLGLAAISHHAVLFLLTEKWIPCVPFVFLGAIYYLFPPIHSVNLEAVKAIGRSDQVLKYGIIKRVVSILTLFISVWFGVVAIAYSLIASAVLATFINAYQNKRLFEYSYKDQFIDMVPNFAQSGIMCVATYFIGRLLPLHSLLIIVIQVVFGAIFYVFVSKIFKNKNFDYILCMVKSKTRKNKGKC